MCINFLLLQTVIRANLINYVMLFLNGHLVHSTHSCCSFDFLHSSAYMEVSVSTTALALAGSLNY